jgi:protein-S-isoprenylcysteine O-methyltransferase Ste14
MSLVPAFDIGVWNAWIFMLYYFLPTPILMLVWAKRTRGEEKLRNETEMKLRPVELIIWLAAFVYSIFLPLRLGTTWFYVGLPILLIGTIGYTAVIPSLITTPIDKELLAKGLYRYSRHPMYITQLAIYIGVGIACASWVFLLFSIVYTILSVVSAISEERYCLEKYGDFYREYLNRTPRWIGIPKS